MEWSKSFCCCHLSLCCCHQGYVSLVMKWFQNKARTVTVKFVRQLNLSWNAEVGSFRHLLSRTPWWCTSLPSTLFYKNQKLKARSFHMYIDCYDISSPEMLANILQGYSEKVRLKFMVMAQQLRKTYQDHKHTVKVGETGNSVDTVERGKQVLVTRGYSLEDLKMTFARVSAKSLRWNSLTFPRLFPDFFLLFPDSPSTFYKLFPCIYPLKIRNFWNVSKFWYFFFNLLFLKKDFLISLKFPDFSLTFH